MARRPRRAARVRSPPPRLELVPIEKLRPHEQLNPKRLVQVRDWIVGDQAMREPILVEQSHYVILNGHHRTAALRELGCRRVAAYVVDYFDERVTVDLWPGATIDRITKEEVIDRGVRGDLFPPKTTRHRVRFRFKDEPVPLRALK